MTDLVAFLRARLDEDGRAIAAILRADPQWRVDTEPWETNGVGIITQRGDSVAVAIGGYTATHIARWDPARVLNELEAKRALLDFLGPWASGPEGGEGHDVADDALRLLALPYADHPDYREEWRP